MKAWKLALAGVIALSGATGANAKITVLGVPARITAADEGDSAERMLVQNDGFADYVKTGYVAATLDWQYGASEPVSGPRVTGERDASDVHSGAASAPSAPMRAKDTGMILLTIGGLVAYQLRRKQQWLERSPISS